MLSLRLDQNGHLLTQEVLEKLAFLASRHLVPNYNNKINKDSTVYPIIMNPKMSNDPYYRIIPYKEKKIVEEALKELENGEWKQEYEKLPKLYKEMYGCFILCIIKRFFSNITYIWNLQKF